MVTKQFSTILTADGFGPDRNRKVYRGMEFSALNGKHSLFLVFDSPVKGKSICEVNELCFVK